MSTEFLFRAFMKCRELLPSTPNAPKHTHRGYWMESRKRLARLVWFARPFKSNKIRLTKAS